MILMLSLQGVASTSTFMESATSRGDDAVAGDTGENTIRHPTLYFNDGDIVLSTETADKKTLLFRVDKIFLARHSKLFADMFALPSVPGVHEEYDGVPLVRLIGDESKGLEDLLGFIYNRSCVLTIESSPELLHGPSSSDHSSSRTTTLRLLYEVREYSRLQKSTKSTL